jgi:glutamate dehydrogenase/leucine dehydrogenase
VTTKGNIAAASTAAAAEGDNKGRRVLLAGGGSVGTAARSFKLRSGGAEIVYRNNENTFVEL